MHLLREIASLGRAARMEAKLKVRQPLAKVEVVLASEAHQPWLETHNALIRDELNVKQVDYTTEGQEYITYNVVPNFKRLGPRVGKLMPKLKQAMAQADGASLLSELKSKGKVTLQLEGESIELDGDDIEVRLQAKAGWAAAQGSGCVVVLSTDLTPELVREGYSKDIIRFIQDRRKQLGCEYTDKIEVGLVTESDEVRLAIEEHGEFIAGETLAKSLAADAIEGAESTEHEIGGAKVTMYVRVN
jgi:isoleucyl-tRNA synthetase